jgi:hypothetical protein
MVRQVVLPSRLPQLRHEGVIPEEARFGTPPCRQQVRRRCRGSACTRGCPPEVEAQRAMAQRAHV